MSARKNRAAGIEAIDAQAVHRICSGQVVVDLAIAASGKLLNALTKFTPCWTQTKELIENSLDAGATSVDVRCVNYGLDRIEVVDNGSGISPSDFESIALKHYTSKLREFDDLSDVTSFGFRGEALSSLCAVGDVQVTTKTASESVGTMLVFDREGKLVSKKPVARSVGTTVVVENVFKTLPVRWREFSRHSKREFGKLVALVQGYALIAQGVRLSLSNSTKGSSKRAGSARRHVVLSTHGRDMRSNLACVYGVKLLEQLTEVDEVVAQQGDGREARVRGFVSKPLSTAGVGSGRSTSDRQHFFVNGRPVVLKKVARAINEVYRSFNNQSGYPIVALDLVLPKHSVDVNITPDKRTVFFGNEPELVEAMKTLFTKIYEPVQYTFPVQSISNFLPAKQPELNRAASAPVKRKAAEESSRGSSPKRAKGVGDHAAVLRRAAEAALAVEEDGFMASSSMTRTVSEPLPVQEARAEVPQSVAEVSDDDDEDEVVMLDAPSAAPVPESDTQVGFDLAAVRSRFLGSVSDASDAKDASIRSRDAAAASHSAPVGADSDLGGEAEVVSEEVLRRVISKEDFLRMEIVGQFNLGFIITRLGNDLFVVDQHATDEKYRFEMLQQSTTINSQRLIRPLPLGTSTTNELTIVEHLEVFKRNGFDFLIPAHYKDETRADGATYGDVDEVMLTALPFSKKVSFGVNDVNDLCEQVAAAPGLFHRPAKVRRMFASRACRSAVMIGTALDKNEMTRIVRHMSTMDQPWNCPHGRPTMRHALDLAALRALRKEVSS